MTSPESGTRQPAAILAAHQQVESRPDSWLRKGAYWLPEGETEPVKRRVGLTSGQWVCRECLGVLPAEGRGDCPHELLDQYDRVWLCGGRFGAPVSAATLRANALSYLAEHAGDNGVPADLAHWIQHTVLKRKRSVFKAYSELRNTLKWFEIGCRTAPPVPKGLEKARRKSTPLSRSGRSRSVRGYVFVLGKLVKRKDW
jgi:hypothetical protein